MRQPLLTLRGYLDVLLVDGTARTARRLGRASASALGALPVAVLLLAAAIGLRATGDAGPVRDAALTAPAARDVAANAVEVRPIQVEIGRIEYLPGETASDSAPGSTDASASTSERTASPVYTFPEVYGDDEASAMRSAPTTPGYLFPEVYGDDEASAPRGVPIIPVYEFPAVYGDDEAR